jgi:hypothetical protein
MRNCHNNMQKNGAEITIIDYSHCINPRAGIVYQLLDSEICSISYNTLFYKEIYPRANPGLAATFCDMVSHPVGLERECCYDNYQLE